MNYRSRDWEKWAHEYNAGHLWLLDVNEGRMCRASFQGGATILEGPFEIQSLRIKVFKRIRTLHDPWVQWQRRSFSLPIGAKRRQAAIAANTQISNATAAAARSSTVVVASQEVTGWTEIMKYATCVLSRSPCPLYPRKRTCAVHKPCPLCAKSGHSGEIEDRSGVEH